jgi:hypothetical protein
VRLDECLGDRQAETGPGPAAVLAEHLEYPFSFLGGDTRTLVGHGYLDERYRGGADRLRADTDRAPVRAQARRILQQVGQDLAHQDMIDFQQGQIGCRFNVHAAPRDQAVDGGEGLVHQLVEGHEGGPDREGP